jgi:RND superfamily putative drug exporter
MLTRLATFVVRRPKVVLLAVAVLLGFGIVFGGTVSEKLGVGGFVDPAAESTQVADFLDETFSTTPNLVLQVVAHDGTVESPGVTAAADRLRQLVETEPTAKVIGSFQPDPAGDLHSRDGRSGLILVNVGGTTDEAAKVASRIIERLPTDDQHVSVRAGGTLGVQEEIEDRVNHDLLISESIALPISLAVLVIVFGGLVAAFLPLAVGLTSIVTTLLVLLVMTTVTDVSVHALTVATAFGLGLSIDFGLLMVSRFREERDRGRDHESAIIATVATAGRTIIFSAATVTLAMGGLLVFPTYFLRSVGITASAVVIVSALSAIVIVPALLALLGKRIDAIAVVRRKVPLSADSMFWRRCAHAVTRRPMRCALPVIAVMLALGIPFLSVQFATPDERALPSDSNARLLAESLREDYAIDSSQAVTLLTRTTPEALNGLAAPVSLMKDVVRVDVPSGSYEHGKLIAGPMPGIEKSGAAYGLVYLSADAQSETAQELVRDIRTKIADHQVEVGGPTATLIDSRAAVADRLPLAILIIALSTFVLLFLFTGSVVVPIKALLLNLLVLSAVLGTMVWIFQSGHLASVLGITPAPLNLSMVVLLCCIAFSLSVDYEIFLLSRIKEARDSGLSNNDAIITGLGRVGRIISSAAILLTITLVSFANGLSFMKMFGIGTALAVVLDATVIRAVVVPAFLRVAGDFNWWAPRPLKWLHDRIGFSEAPPPPAIPAPVHHAPRPNARRPLKPAAPVYPTPVQARAAGTVPGRRGDVLSTASTVRICRPLRYIVLDDNSRFVIDRDCVAGRSPHDSNAVRGGLRPVRIEGHTGGMSRAHIEIRRVNGEVLVVDRGSTNGVLIREPEGHGWTRLAPWQPVVWRPGASVRIGSRTLRLESVHHTPAPARQSGHRMRRSDHPAIDMRRATSTPGSRDRHPAMRGYPVGAGVDVH